MGKPRVSKRTKRLAHNAVAIVTALSLVFLQTPVSYAVPQDAPDDTLATQQVADQAADAEGAAKGAAKDEAGTDADAAQAAKDASDDAAKGTADVKASGADKPEAAQQAQPAKAADAESPAGEGKAQDSAKDGAKAADAAGSEKPAEGAKDAAADAAAPTADAQAEPQGAAPEASEDKADAARPDAAGAAAAEDAKADSDKDAEPKAEAPATKRVYTFEDAAVKVTATLQKADAIPDDAELKVAAVTPQTRGYNYDAYMEALNKDVGEQDAYTAENTLLYDVAFLAKDADGNTVELQPESGSVKVVFEFKKAQLSEGIGADAKSLQVVHLPLKDAAKQDVATTKDAIQIAAADVKADALDADEFSMSAANAVELKADSFSVFAFYTVDFTHDGYTYSIAGEGEILLSALFDALDIDEDVADVANVAFSTPKLVAVAKAGADWKITSLKPFSSEETLTIEMKSGTTYVIAVTDAQDMTYTLKFYDRDGSDISGVPNDVNGDPYLFAYLTDSEGNISGWASARFANGSLQATLPSKFNSNPWSETADVTYDPEVHTLNLRVVRGSHSGSAFFANGWDEKIGNVLTGNPNWNGYDQFAGYKFVTDNPEPNVFKLQRDWDKELEVELSYAGSDSGSSASGTIIVRGKASSGWQYYKLPVNNISWNDGVGTYKITEWLNSDGNPSGNPYSDAWQGVEAVLFKGDVSIAAAKGFLENGSGSTKPVYYLAGYQFQSGAVEGRAGSVNEETGIQTMTLPIVLNGEPLEAATTPEEILGDAAEYGIVAGQYTQTGHTETNYAVKVLTTTANNNLDYHEMGRLPFYVGQIDGKLWLAKDNIQAPADLYVTESDVTSGKVELTTTADVNIIPTPKNAIDSHVDALINYVDGVSADMSKKTTITPSPASNDKDYELDTTSFPEDATIYVDARNLTSLMANKKLSINKLPGQYIVFNVPGKA